MPGVITDYRTSAPLPVNNLNAVGSFAVMLSALDSTAYGFGGTAGPLIFAEVDIDGGKIKQDAGAGMVRNEQAVILMQETTRDEWMYEATILNPDDPKIRTLMQAMESRAFTFKLVLAGTPAVDGTARMDVYALRNGRLVAGWEKNTAPGVRRRAAVFHGSRTYTLPSYNVETVDPTDETGWGDSIADVLATALDVIP